MNKLLKKEGLKSIIRAHEVEETGYKFHFWNGDDEFPPVVTIFSAPNYCGYHENQAAVIVSQNEDFKLKTFFDDKNAPYTLPDDDPLIDAFSFFNDELCGWVLEFLYEVL